MSENGSFCEIPDLSSIPWSVPLPKSDVLMVQDLWNAVLDPEVKNKGRMIAVLYAALGKSAVFGNNCPSEVREKIEGMML